MARILIVDDEHSMRDCISRALKRQGHDTLLAENVASGTALASERLPDLIISDICMEGGDGFSFLRTIRENPRTGAIPFIIVTGNPDHEGMLKSFAHAADGYLPKPFSLPALIDAVEKRLRREEIVRRDANEIKIQLIRVLEAAPDLIATFDPETQSILFLNLAGKRMLEVFAEPKKSFTEFFSEPGAETFVQDYVPHAAKNGEWKGSAELFTLSGRRIAVELVLQCHRSHNQKVEYFSVIARDLTEREQNERARQEFEVQLRQAQKLESIGQLAAGIAHEINTPTQYIGDNTRFLKEAFASVVRMLELYEQATATAGREADLADFVKKIEKAREELDMAFLLQEIPSALNQSLEGIERVSRIVRAMKDFSHPNSAEKSLVDINKAIESTLMVARNEWKYVAEVETCFDPKLCSVPCLPGELNQVILNLVVNASHAIGDVVSGTERKGTIRITTAAIGDWAEIRIADTGTGIPKEAQPRLFEPFFTTKEVGRGTGQGLAIARSVVVDKHSGTIGFETELGRGTTFTIRLPLSVQA